MKPLISLNQAQTKINDLNHWPGNTSLVTPGCTGDLGCPRFKGRLGKKPWDYPITVVIPHLGPVEALDVVIALFQAQTVVPYILVIDTGSPWECLEPLEKLRAPYVEIHYIRSHGYRHSSSPVSAALDLGFDLCRTEFLFLTHNDVFLRARNVLAWFMERCNWEEPVIGYQMSPRESGEGDPIAYHYTHTALVDTSVDIRDSFNLGPSGINDTCYVPDMNGTPFGVRFVETVDKCKRAYLDRGQPRLGWPSNNL